MFDEETERLGRKDWGLDSLRLHPNPSQLNQNHTHTPRSFKDKYTKLIVETLCNIRLLDLLPVLKTLATGSTSDDAQLLDTCLKYVYRGMASPELYNSASLLAIHEKVFFFN